MSKTILHKGMALFMAFTVFIQTVGFAVDVHYCKGELDNYSFFGKAVVCDMADTKASEGVKMRPCCKKRALSKRIPSTNEAINNLGCCTNEMFSYAGETDFQQSVTAIDLDQGAITLFNARSFLTLDLTSSLDKVPFHIPPPPLLKPQRLVLFQVFRV